MLEPGSAVFSFHQTLGGIGAFGWCCLLFCSLVGWGRLVAFLAKINAPGMAIAAGMGLVSECLIGGILNLGGLVYPAVLLAFTAIGLVLFFVFRETSQSDDRLSDLLWKKASPLQRSMLVVISVATAVHVFSFVRPYFFNPWDDYQAYMVLPWKMLQVHHLAFDPYSQRRVINSVGFVYFLQDTFLVAAPLKNITLVDGGLGLLMLVTSAAGMARALKMTATQALWLLLLAGMTKQLAWNLSFSWLPCGLYLLMVLLALRQDLRQRPRLQALLIGATVGVNAALKNNHIVCSVLFVLSLYGLNALADVDSSGRERVTAFIRGVGLAAACALVVLIPWMIDLKHNTGTYFFPLLGHGYEYTTYHLLPVRNVNSRITTIKCFIAGVPILVLAIIEGWYFLRVRQLLPIVAFTVASGASIIVVALSLGGDMIRRYTYAQSVAAILLLIPAVAIAYRHVAFRFKGAAQTLAILFGCMAVASDAWHVRNGFTGFANLYQEYAYDVVTSWLNYDLNVPGVKKEYLAAQDSIPKGGVVLENASYAYNFDYRRNTIYEASLPGMASPPPAPGWPVMADGDTLGRWLVGHGVRYLIYSYGDEALQETEKKPAKIADPSVSIIMKSTDIAALNAYHQYMELARTRKKLFDDGMLFVLDLETGTGRDLQGE